MTRPSPPTAPAAPDGSSPPPRRGGGDVGGFLRKMGVLISVGHAEMTEYRAEIYLWVVSGILPFILMGLWMRASVQADLGMGPEEFGRYYLSVFVIRQATLVWVIYEVERAVVQGALSPMLLHPIDPFWRYLASHLAERITRLPFLLLLCGIFFLLYPASFWVPDAGSALKAAVCILAAFLLRFVMQYAFAMIAFWSERANAIEDFWFFMYIFLSGYVAPLSLFPPGVRRVAEFTPFPYLVHTPARLLMGQPADLGKALLVMGIWGAVFLALYRVLWRCGLRKYSAMGA